MIFIVGGAFQGKGAFAETHFKGKNIVVHYEETIREELLSWEGSAGRGRRLS